MKIKLLGTGSSAPSLRRFASSCLVLTDSGTMLIDVGPSIVRRLLESGFSPRDVDVIAITHFHPDHTVDLTTFLFACNYAEPMRERPLTIIGGKGIRGFYRRLARLFPWVEAKGRYAMTLKTVANGKWRLGALAVFTAPVSHRDESIALRIEEKGKKVVFSGDTGYSPTLPDFAAGADLLILECTFPTKQEEGHLNLPATLAIAEAAKPSHVILTHLAPEWEDFDRPLPSPLLLGEDGMEIDV